jgi:hypothetical protein
MPKRAVALALTMAFVLFSPQATKAQSIQAASSWQRIDSEHFEIHYQPTLAPRLGHVVQSAERAYDRIAGQLNFVWPTKVPLVVFAPSGSMTRAEVRAFTGSAPIAPTSAHRSRLDLPLPESDSQFDALIVHELTHVLVSALVWQDRIGDGGLPHWIKEGVAEYMVGVWRDEDVRQMRELVASEGVPALSELNGSGGFTNARVNNAIGHAVFDYIESRWGPNGIRRFLDGLSMPRISKTYNAVLDLTPEGFDIAFRENAVRRFGQGAR